MKRGLFYFGLFIALIGLVFTIKNVDITGFAILDSIKINISMTFSMIMFLGGVLIAASGDSLQAWLERKEKESSSPSLEGVMQTEREKKHFAKRSSEKVGLWKKIFGYSHVEQVPQNDKKYTKEVYLGSKLSEEKQAQLRLEMVERKDWEGKIAEIRRGLMNAKIRIERDLNDDRGYDNKEHWNEYVKYSNLLTKAYGVLNLPDSGDRRTALLKQKEMEQIEKDKERLEKGIAELEEDFTQNRISLTTRKSTFTGKLDRLYNIRERSGIKRPLPNIRDFERRYAKGVKTESIADASKEYNTIFVHSLPSLVSGVRAGNSGLAHRHDLTASEFLKTIFTQKPMLSASSTTPYGKIRWAVGEAGVLLKDGNIYDASFMDLNSQADRDTGARFADINKSEDLPIKERVREAVYKINPNSPNGHNEFIIGDYEVGGLYFTSSAEQHGDLGRGIIRDVAREALNRSVPLYRYAKESKSGNYKLEEVSPRDYLESERPSYSASATTTRKPLRRTAKKSSSGKRDLEPAMA